MGKTPRRVWGLIGRACWGGGHSYCMRVAFGGNCIVKSSGRLRYTPLFMSSALLFSFFSSPRLRWVKPPDGSGG